MEKITRLVREYSTYITVFDIYENSADVVVVSGKLTMTECKDYVLKNCGENVKYVTHKYEYNLTRYEMPIEKFVELADRK